MLSTDDPTRRGKATALLPLALLLVVVMSACGARLDSPSDEAFWHALRITGDEVEGYTSLQDMAKHADLVVVGSFSIFGPSRTLQGDAPGDIVGYAAATVRVEELLSGSPPPDPLVVEFLLPTTSMETSTATFLQKVGDLAAQLPKVNVVLFLREKRGAGEEGLFRLVNSFGLWTEVDGTLMSPLHDAMDEGESPYAAELKGIASIQALAELLR